jgi:hypothetical protein
MDLIDLCNKGLEHAQKAWDKAPIDSAEEELAQCFHILFFIFKETLQDDDDWEPIKVK